MVEIGAELRRLTKIVETIRQVDPQFPPQCLLVLLLIAARPGISQAEVATQTGLPSSSVSRNVTRLGTRDRNGSEGYGLVSQVAHPADDRALALYLTVKGRDTVRGLLKAAAGEPADAFNPRTVR